MTPENINLLPLYILGGAAGFWIIIAVSGALPALAMWRARVEPAPEDEAQTLIRSVLSSGKVTGAWAIAEGFEPVGVVRVKDRLLNAAVVGWRRAQDGTYLCAYVIFGSRIELDIVSSFGEDSHLTTGSMRDGQLLPTSPDNWLQSFSVSDVTELWGHHQAALEYLKGTANLQAVSDNATFADFFQAGLQHQAQYIRSLPFWVMRIPYWYFVRRLTRHNKPLAEFS
jgi:hypothetical protein